MSTNLVFPRNTPRHPWKCIILAVKIILKKAGQNQPPPPSKVAQKSCAYLWLTMYLSYSSSQNFNIYSRIIYRAHHSIKIWLSDASRPCPLNHISTPLHLYVDDTVCPVRCLATLSWGSPSGSSMTRTWPSTCSSRQACEAGAPLSARSRKKVRL